MTSCYLMALIGGEAGYREMLDEQGGGCAICGELPDLAHSDGQRLAIDHDHLTGMVRGLLCTRCNVGLGSFRDDTDSLEQARLYVEHYREGHAAATDALAGWQGGPITPDAEFARRWPC